MFIKIGDPQPITGVFEKKSDEELEKLKKDYKLEKTKKEAEDKPQKELN